MANKLTRCICGKIYDPAENSLCPSCGAEPRNEAPPAQLPPEPKPVQTTSELRVPQLDSGVFPKPLMRTTKRGIQLNLTAEHLVRIGVGLIVIVGAIAGAWHLFHRPDDDKKSAKVELNAGDKKTDSGKTDSADKTDLTKNTEAVVKADLTPTKTESNDKVQPKPDPDAKPKPSVDPAAPKTWIVDAQNGEGADGTEIAPVLGKAKEGDTIVLKPGTYAGGFDWNKKIRIAGENADPGKFVITSKDQKRSIQIQGQGIVLANVQILQAESGRAVITFENGSESVFEGCDLKFKGGASAMIGRSAASFTARNCTFSCEASRVMIWRGPSKIEMADCTFSGGNGAFHADHESQFVLHGCKFKDIGEKGTKEPALKVFGAGSSITAEDCTFSSCRMPVQAEEGAKLSLTKCNFTGNGVPGEKGDFTQGIVAVNKNATATLKDVTFEKNMQGINASEGGMVQMDDCKFNNCGLLLKDAGFMNFCVPLKLNGEGAKAIVRHSTFALSKPYAILIADGASVSVDDSDFTGTQLTALIADRTAEMKAGVASEVTVTKSRFSGNYECISLNGAKGTVDGCELRDNISGLSASGAGTTAKVTGGVSIGQKDYGFLITSEAMATIQGVKFEGNQHGIQVGVSGKPAERGSALLEECKFSGSTDADVLAYQPSKVTLRMCEFDPDGGAKVKREKGAVIESEPPLIGIVDIGKKGASSGGSTASNNKGTPSKGRSTPSRSQPQPSDTIRNIINSVDRMRRIFR